MRLTLRARFAYTFAALILLSSAVLSLTLGLRARDMAREQIGSALADAAAHMTAQLDRSMWARSKEVQVLASLDVMRRPDDPAAVRRVLDRLREAIPLYSWVGLLDAKGRVLEATGGVLKGVDISARPVFAKGSQGLFIGDVHDAVLLSKLLPNPTGEAMKFVDVSVPLIGPDGTLHGVLAAHLSWEWAGEVQRSILGSLKEARGVDLFIMAADGTVLLGGQDQLGKPLSLPVADRVRGQQAPAWAVERWTDGQEYLTGAAFGDGHLDYPGLGWTVVARQPLDVAYAPVNALIRDIFLVGAALSCLFALAGWLTGSRVIKPLKAITQAADRLRMGENIAMPEHHDIPEIETLADSLTHLVASLTTSEIARDRMERLATRDPLTGLANRLGLAEHLSTTLPRMERKGGELHALCMDLDGFKGVNDRLGHAAGDELLRQVAGRLSSCLRGGDLLARQGGDEFLVLAETRPDGVDQVETLARRILGAVAGTYALPEGQAVIGVSIGLATWPTDGTDMDAVLARADEALYRAKRAGKGRLVRAGE